jgi:hypothetical protein
MGERYAVHHVLELHGAGIREIKDDLKRAQAAQDLAKKCGCENKQIFLTSGENDLIQIIETANADNIAKYVGQRQPGFCTQPYRPRLAAGRGHKDHLRTAVRATLCRPRTPPSPDTS